MSILSIPLSLFALTLCGPAASQDDAKLAFAHEFQAHAMPATHVAFDPRGEFLATTSFDGAVKLFSTETWELVTTIHGNRSSLWTVDFSPDGKWIASAGDFEVFVHERPKGKKKTEWKEVASLSIRAFDMEKSGSCYDLNFSLDGKLLFVGTFEGEVDVWDTKKWKKVDSCSDHEGFPDGSMVEFLSMHPDGKTVLSGGKTKATRILRVGKPGKNALGKADDERKKGWTTVEKFPDEPQTHRMCGSFSPDGKEFVIGGTDGRIQVFSCKTWEETKSFVAHPGGFSAALTYARGGAVLLTAGSKLKLWDTKTWEPLGELELDQDAQHMTASPDGKRIAIACAEGGVKIFDVPGE